MDKDPVRAIVERHFRVYDHRQEKVQGSLAARLFFIMVDAAQFDASYERVRQELREKDPELLVFVRRQGGEDILFVTERPPAGGKDHRIAGTLLALTFITTTIQGALYWKGFSDPGSPWSFAVAFETTNLLWGFLTFSLPLMAILIVHESAHFITARRHGLRPSLPFFIPLPPIGYFGTMGAFIRMRDPLPDRRSLFDVGASGPIAGFIVAIPLLILGSILTTGAAVDLPDTHDPIIVADGFEVDLATIGEVGLTMDPAVPGIWFIEVESTADDWTYSGTAIVQTGGTAIQDTFSGELDAGKRALHSFTVPEDAVSVQITIRWDDGLVRFGDPLIVKALDPLIGGDGDHLTHPLFFAGWVGVFITGLNLLPLGQLDGGHVSRAVFGDKARHVAVLTMGFLIILSFWFQMWLVLALLVFFFMGTDHPPPLNDRTALDPSRRILAVVVLAILLVSFVPVPIIL